MSDCDDYFTITVGVTIGVAAAATAFGTPLAGGSAILSGVGGAYAALYVCQRGVVRDWKNCRGY